MFVVRQRLTWAHYPDWPHHCLYNCPSPFAQDDDDSDDDLKHDDERNEKDSRIILLSHFMVNAFNVDLGNTI